MFNKIKVYQRVIFLIWLGLSAGELRAVVSLDNGTGTIEFPISTDITTPLQATNVCNGTSGTFSVQIQLGTTIPAGETYWARFDLNNSATFYKFPTFTANVGEVNIASGYPTANYAIFDLKNSTAIAQTTIVLLCTDSVQVTNTNPVDITYTLYSNPLDAINKQNALVTRSAQFLKFITTTTDCNKVTEIPVSECNSLLELYNSTNGENWTNKTGWNQTNTPCSWYGVTCSAGHVQQLSLYSNQLRGSIPNFTNLPNLKELYLFSNQLSGSIPNFTNLPNLKELELHYNLLSGSIPNFTNLPNLTGLWLYKNQLSGSIPNFNNLPNLQLLDLYENQLSGSIPNFNNLPNLLNFSLNLNQLSGNIPNFTSFNLANLYAQLNNNCGLTAYDATQEAILNQKDPSWKTRNPNCPVSSYNLTLNKTGNGQISGGGSFTANSSVNLTATPDAGWSFNGWSPSPCNSSFLMPANDLTCTATFSQIVCNYSLNPTSANHSANTENGSFNLTVTNGCNWSASSNQSWVRISNPSGSGNTTISYSVDANPNTTARSAIISINGQSFTVNQAAKTVTLNPSIEISSNSLTFSQQIPSIDVMVIYTQAAANETPNISNEIKATIDQTNTAYRNSGINQRLNLVYAAQINYQEADNMGVDLNRLTATNDGFIDEIHGLRDTYKADLVSLWRKNSGNKCGIGWLLVENSAVFQSVGFNVVSRSCAVTNLSFAHELGHNMGAHHDSYIAKENGLHNYSHGYTYLNQINPSQSWRTIMAYVDECLVKGYGSCARIPYFSNPNIFYQNIPTGHSLANNAATLNESSTAVGSFRGGSQSKETQLLTISNKGSANLNVSNIFTDNNVSWLSITPTSLSITPNNSEQVQITVDYSLIPAGISNSGLTINSNDPAKPALSVTVNAQSTGQMDMMTVDSSKSNVYDALKQKLKLDVNVPNAARRSGVDSFRVSLKPVDLVEKPNTLVFELEEAQQLNANLEGKSTHYDVHSGIVNVPAVNVPDQIGMPQLFSAKLQWLSQRTDKLLFEVVDANAIPMIAVE